MKAITRILLFIIIVSGNITVADNINSDKESKKLISGKLIDKKIGEEIAGAEIKIADKIY